MNFDKAPDNILDLVITAALPSLLRDPVAFITPADRPLTKFLRELADVLCLKAAEIAERRGRGCLGECRLGAMMFVGLSPP